VPDAWAIAFFVVAMAIAGKHWQTLKQTIPPGK